MNRKQLLLSAVISALGAIALPAIAQDAPYPQKPITLVVPFPAGGATDVIGRVIAKKLGERLGQNVVIDNRGGAGTTIGAAYVAKAAPDGYTLLISSGTTFTVNPAVRAKLPYDPVKSFEPIGITGRTGLILLANKDVPVADVKQFVAALKAAPEKYSYGSFGAGTTSQFAGEMFFHAAGVKIQHVPYKGSAPAMTDLISGQIPFTVDTVSAALPHLKDGRIKAIAVTTGKRSPLLPKVPTLNESGYPGLDMDTWLAIVAPRGLPSAVKSRLELTLAQVVSDPETRDKMIGLGFEQAYGSSKSLAELIDKELPLMRAVAQRANITAD